ncbi:hypothetical protein GCM10009104_08610 [Marinobacterium maritimum]|uniref:Uncharacterized protein n=1 Tax=Marinobacterium maritimum TaxID=500162 RepID=A0ABP3T9U8_9GAMM
MIKAVIAFQDGNKEIVCLLTRPVAGEYIEHAGDYYLVKSVIQHTATKGGDTPPRMEITVGMGRRKGSHGRAMEDSECGFFTGV